MNLLKEEKNKEWKTKPSDIASVLLKTIEENPAAVVLSGTQINVAESMKKAEDLKKRILFVHNAEQNAFGIAAGLALEGKEPFIYTKAVFASMRACEQLRTDICFPNLSVRIIADNAGLTSRQGAVYNAQEDIAILRSFANLTIVAPSSAGMFYKLLKEMEKHQGPVYIRINSEDLYETSEKEVEDIDFAIGRAYVVKSGSDITLAACGLCVKDAVQVAETLEERGVSVRVLDVHTIKPLDRNCILNAARETGRIITIEDHYIIGGLGSAVAELLAEIGVPCKFKRLGIPQVYAGYGSSDSLHKKYAYDTDGIVQAANALLNVL